MLILASGSPRRRQLLGGLGVPFEVRAPEVDESVLPGEAPDRLVERLALWKATTVLAGAPEAEPVVLAADTVAAVRGEILGKPTDEHDAVRMLRLLSGSRHQVLTGVAVGVRHGDGSVHLRAEVVLTWVHMALLTDADIEAYVATGEPLDKAGAYAIQEVGDRFVERIDGPFDNVVGLPVAVARRLLDDAGVALAQPPEV